MFELRLFYVKIKIRKESIKVYMKLIDGILSHFFWSGRHVTLGKENG